MYGRAPEIFWSSRYIFQRSRSKINIAHTEVLVVERFITYKHLDPWFFRQSGRYNITLYNNAFDHAYAHIVSTYRVLFERWKIVSLVLRVFETV
jgi:hypothetical protein